VPVIMLLKELRLQANHPRALHNFYKEILEPPANYEDGSIMVAAGKSKLIFEQRNDHENPFYHFAFNIPGNKFEEALQWMKRKAGLLWPDDYKGYPADFIGWHVKSI
jgi:hypothetical protein